MNVIIKILSNPLYSFGGMTFNAGIALGHFVHDDPIHGWYYVGCSALFYACFHMTVSNKP